MADQKYIISGVHTRIPAVPHELTDRITPVDKSIVLCHLGVPYIEADEWLLTIDGMVENPTIVTWEMKENNGKTWLTFTHSGFEADHDVSGLYTGWRNFVNWVRSVSEYGAAWYPPIAVLNPGMGYPASMYSAQDQIVEELRETA